MTPQAVCSSIMHRVGYNTVCLTLVKGGEEYDTPGSVQQYHAQESDTILCVSPL